MYALCMHHVHVFGALAEVPPQKLLTNPKMHIACQNCRRLKIKCVYNPATSSCTKCTSRKISCILITPKKRGPRLKPETNGVDPTFESASVKLNIPSNVLHMLVTGFTLNPIIKQLPIVHMESFFNDFQAGDIPAYLFISALSFAARAHLAYGGTSLVDRESVCKLAQELEDRARKELSGEEPCAQVVQAYFLLAFGNVTCGDIGNAYMTIGMGTRCAFDIQLNQLDVLENSLTPLQREMRRRVWWGCFIADRMSSIISALPFQVTEDDIQVKLPGDGKNWQTARQPESCAPLFHRDEVVGSEHDATQPSLGSLSGDYSMAYLIRLITIAGRISSFERRSHKRPGQTLKDNYGRDATEYRTLHSLLCTWLNVLPLDIAQQITTPTHPVGKSEYEVHPAWIGVFYHTCLLILSRTWMKRYMTYIEVEEVTCPTGLLIEFKKMLESALQAFAMLKSLFKSTGTEMIAFPMASYSIYQCAIVFLHGSAIPVKLARHLQVIVEEVAQYKDICLQSYEECRIMLEQTAKISPLAVKHLELLEFMKKQRETVVNDCEMDVAKAYKDRKQMVLCHVKMQQASIIVQTSKQQHPLPPEMLVPPMSFE
jgi:hypothetical protein